MEKQDLKEIQRKIGYQFNNIALLFQAFTRKSYSNQFGGENNENDSNTASSQKEENIIQNGELIINDDLKQVIVDGKEVKMEVKVGDKVIYSKYAGTDVKLDGEEYVIVRQSDILAIVE